MATIQLRYDWAKPTEVKLANGMVQTFAPRKTYPLDDNLVAEYMLYNPELIITMDNQTDEPEQEEQEQPAALPPEIIKNATEGSEVQCSSCDTDCPVCDTQTLQQAVETVADQIVTPKVDTNPTEPATARRRSRRRG
jgi:hypothetical protein